MGGKKPTVREEESIISSKQGGGGGKLKKKNMVIDDDEYSMATEISDEPTIQEEQVAPTLAFGKRKSKKGKKRVASVSSYGVGGDSDQEAESVASSKPGKSSARLFTTSVFHTIDDEDNEDGQLSEDDEDPALAFTGKGNGISFRANLLDEESDADTSVKLEAKAIEGDDAQEVIFSGKKKSSKKKNKNAFSTTDVDVGNDLSNVADQDQASVGVNREEADDNRGKKQATDVSGTSKNKAKKKKGGRTAQPDEDEIDKILAEIGEGQPTSTPAHASLRQKEKSQLQSQLGDDSQEKEAVEEGTLESAAAKKKKKKKEKEKEKKAAAAASIMEEKQEETRNDTKGKLADKKQSKQVREMQERLKKMKEAEERKKKEEEERLRKEEEERHRQEELERLEEEKKRLKKEKEKEKLLKKKQEGKLLTGKQKEEARRLEAMRKQFLANGGDLPLSTGESTKEATKRPIYQKKKSKPQAQANGKNQEESVERTEVQEHQQDIVSEVESMESEKVKDMNSDSIEKKSKIAAAEENGVEEEEDDEEWDAKSWDDADLKLPGKSAFEDEEIDSHPQPIIKKEIKAARSAASDAGPLSVAAKSVIPSLKVAASVPAVTKNDGSKTREPEVGIAVAGTEKCGASSSQSEYNLRSPISCIMGHVDAGKTKLLDCIRGTNVQEGEAGGITQQIGATYFPAENIRERTKELRADATLRVPGLLVIDTPGHESFTNLRSRGSCLCDIAILVVDIMHGLEPQTIESLNLLKMRNTEFIVALNKVDRLYGWKVCRNAPIVKAMKQQSKDVHFEFNTRLTQVITQFKEQGINTELYYKNKEMGKDTFSIVPTSAISGEGIPDLLLLLVQWTQKTMVGRLTYSNEVQCTVLEVKVVEGQGTTIDVVLVNGVLHEGDQIVVCGMQDPIVTSIRALLTPDPMKELRVKGSYMQHKDIKAARGIKINAQGLEHAIAGTSLYVVGPNDDVEDIKEAAMEDMRSVMNRIDKRGEGVYVQASTLGSLEALLEFLKTPEVSIPVSGIGIGPVHKKDVMKASVMLEKKKEYATILAFDVKVTQEARELADEVGVKIFIADIIYHLFDQFKAYIDNIKEEKMKEVAEEAVFPCLLKIVPNRVFNKKDPIVLGADVLKGIVKVGTPICIPQREFIDIGRIASIQNNHKPVDYAKKGQQVAIKIVGTNPEEQQKMFGRHFDIEDELVSKISRRSIDILKANFRNDLSVEDWRLVNNLKNLFKIQ
ncbi:PREDICTED: eukaryotic translation initiation factor 5B-like [Nicotiana attenuata]|uniref:Eukaryotic translation initiation factor 5B n=1 Tax=Nicotiana attenuata TaxID=49451 RepID=A0A1J6IFZ5_NICAT|nr:PREDICTED: eukaryotic translation initiation factor 5B-like [Nicotiana attenuata]XP_019245625.1 PREDICTED: eukaryotic translation initiation factor 5B-like [Nicotiana attenuata]OIT03308.1 translation initiation factor if-2, chloroplastic [Nicotiana attenuata]